jgi:hypothetical protein
MPYSYKRPERDDYRDHSDYYNDFHKWEKNEREVDQDRREAASSLAKSPKFNIINYLNVLLTGLSSAYLCRDVAGKVSTVC